MQTSAVLACLTIVGNLSSAKAVVHRAPAVASVLLRTEIVFVGILGALWLGERLSWGLVVGAVVALLGLVVMRWPLAWDGSALGALWALGAAGCFAGMQVVTRRVAMQVPLVLVNTLRLWLAVMAWSLLPGHVREVSTMPLEFWWQVTLAALFGPFLGRVFIMLSLRQLRAAQSALLLLLAPVVAFLIAFFAFGERPTGLELSGASLVLLGVALPMLPGGRARLRGYSRHSSPRG
jgi:drug/metabolite transporter (DMT)-like permease